MPVREDAIALGVDPDLAEAVQSQESGGDPNAVSPKGAEGSMQVMPATGAEMAAKVGPDKATQGVQYLKEMHDRYSGLPPEEQRKFALAAYNAGPNRVRHAQARATLRGLDSNVFDHVARFLPKETQNYVPGVLKKLVGKGTTVTPGAGVSSVTQTSPEAELDALIAGGQGGPATATGTATAESPESELDSMIQGGAGEPTRATQQPRSLAENAAARVPGLQGWMDIAQMAGHLSGIRKMSPEEMKAMEARGQQMLEHPIATDVGAAAQIAGTALAPGATALSAGAGIATEEATGSKTAGDVAEVVAPFAPAAGKIVSGAARGAKALTGGAKLAEEVAGDVGAGADAVEAGKVLQGKGQGARKAVSNVAEESSTKYQEAQAAAQAGNVVVPAADRSLVKAAGQARRDAAAAGGSIPGGAKRVMNNILRLRSGGKSKILTAAGKPASTAAKDISVSDLIEQQSNLRREISQLPYNHPARGPLQAFDEALDNAMDAAGKNNPDVMQKLEAAREHYRTVTVPTKKTAGAITKAETPEQAARRATSGKQPSRFERLASAEPSTAEPMRESFWNDAIEAATNKADGSFDLASFAKKMPKGRQLEQMADTPAKKLVVKAVQTAVRQQKGMTNIGSILGAGAGVAAGRTLGVGGASLGGIGGYFGMHQVLKSAMSSEPIARALYRVAKARAGSPGYTMAVNAIKKALGKGTAAAAGAVGRQNAA